MIEFCCPVCLAPLAVEPKVAGGQVNCPKCLKLILIPDKTPLERTGEQAPYSHGAQHPGDVVARAIGISVEPYRRELETKTGLLNDAVEMIKTRNQRIKEIESLILKTQKDLWEMEVREEDHAAAHSAELAQVEAAGMARAQEQLQQANARIAELEAELATQRSRLAEQEAALAALEDKKDTLKQRLANLATHAEEQQHDLDAFHQLITDLEPSRQTIAGAFAWMGELVQSCTAETEELRQVTAALARSTALLERLPALISERDQWRAEAARSREELEALRHQSGREAEELSARLDELQVQFKNQEGLLEEALRVQRELLSQRAELRRALEDLLARIDAPLPPPPA